MKKLLLAAILATGAAVPMAAAEFSVLFEGEPIENGSTIEYDGFDVEVMDMSEYGYGIFYSWKVDPELYLVSDEVAPMTIHAQSLTGVEFQLCAGGLCLKNTVITKAVENLKADVPLNLQLDWATNTQDISEIDIPAMEILVDVYYTSNPSSALTFTLKMGGFKAAGVDSVVSNENEVVLKGRDLYYDVAGTSQLSVYSLSGKTVLNKTVSGNGSVSLEGLSKGVYLYRLSGKTNKTSKFILK